MRILALLLPLTALTASAQTQADAPKPARIEGAVVTADGEPVPRAQVTLQGRPVLEPGQRPQVLAFSATTNDAGRFVIDNIAPGPGYQLTAERTGFVTGRWGARTPTGPAAPVTLETGETRTGMEIRLVRQGVIAGRVTDQNGDPLQRVQVQLMRTLYSGGVRQMAPSSSATTDDQGEYRIAGIAPGRYYVAAAAAAQFMNPFQQSAGPTDAAVNLMTYYPGSGDPRAAVAFEITPGAEHRGIDIRMRRGRQYAIRGQAVDPGGAPLGGVLLMALPKEGYPLAMQRSQTQVRPDGSFELRGLDPGAYVVNTQRAVINGQPTAPLAGRVEVQIRDQDAEGVRLVLTPGSIRGSVRVEEGELSEVLAPAQGQPARLSVTVAFAEGPNLNAPSAPVQPDGSILLEGISAGRQVFTFFAPESVYVKSAQWNGVDLLRNPVDFSGGEGQGLNVVLSKKAAAISGTVRNDKGEPAAGIPVTIWPRDAMAGSTAVSMRNLTTDANGRFEARGLRPGVYYAAAWEQIETGLATVPEFQAQFTSEAGRLELQEGASATADLKPISAAKIQAAGAKLP